MEDAMTHSENDETPKETKSCVFPYFPRRYLVAILSFFGLVNIYALRVNLSVAIVDMVANKTAYINGTDIVTENAEFIWNSTMQGVILSSFFYGYIFTQIPGSYLATLVPAVRVARGDVNR